MHARPRRTATATILLAVCAALSASGCTLAGLGIGAIADSQSSKLQPAPVWQVTALGAGTRIALDLSDGRRLEGELSHTALRAPEDYAAAYDAAGLGQLPQLGPCVLGGLSPQPEQDVEWVGIDLTGVVVRMAGMQTTIPFERVGALRDGAGRVVSGPALQQLVHTRQVPLLSTIVLKGVKEPVPVEQVVQIEVARKQNGKLVGTLTGLAIDAIIVAMVASSMEEWGTTTSCTQPTIEGCASCPFASSFDGTQYVRDAEVLGTATLEAAQQTDRAELGHLADVDGTYRLRIANELREIDSIDAVRLVVADAPPGTRVVAAPDGRLLALAHPVTPLRVEDLRGNDVTRLVRATDGTVWLSSPWGRSANRAADLRDGLEMEFERPPGADSVTMAFRLRSTTWAVQLLTEALALHGRDLAAWRARMNADARARAAFLGALRREVLPSVSVWDGRTWRPAGVLMNLGPWMDRDQALRISLDGVAGPTLRVRFESTPGLWVVDSVVADFETPSAIEVVVLAARRADLRGEDVRTPLADVDASRVTLEQGDSIEMAFDAPCLPANRARSVFVEATGYYTPLVPADRDPHPEVFEELVNQPGAVARWSLGLVRESGGTR